MRRAALLGLALLSGCAHLYYVPLPPEAEVHTAHTADGWNLELVRYQAVGEVTGPPVLLVHGIAANGRNMDLDEHHSMARWFASKGREAWTLSLRGTGGSDRPDEAKGLKPGYLFDDHWQFDLPAAVALVRQVSGAKQIDYVGHSMGGMVLYAWLSQGGTGIRAAATLGSPTRLDWGSGLIRLARDNTGLVGRSWMLPSGAGAHVSAPFQTWFDDGPFQRFFYNPQSTKPEVWRRLVAYGTSDVSGGIALQLVKLMRTGGFTSANGLIDFKKDMGRIRTPILVVAARLDRVALSPAVKDAYRALGGPKEWVLITRANGARGEYGHMDLVIGERAAEEVWSKALDFFDRHARKEP